MAKALTFLQTMPDRLYTGWLEKNLDRVWYGYEKPDLLYLAVCRIVQLKEWVQDRLSKKQEIRIPKVESSTELLSKVQHEMQTGKGTCMGCHNIYAEHELTERGNLRLCSSCLKDEAVIQRQHAEYL